MKLEAQVESLQDIKALRKKIQIVKIQFQRFQAEILNRISKELILNTIHRKMRNETYSEKIISGTQISGVNVMSKNRFRIFFRSEYFADNGFDVALAREQDGTVDHIIKPLNVKALHWENDKFSKGHEVSGIDATHIIRDTLDESAAEFLTQINMLKKQWIEQQFGGLVKVAV